MQINKIIPSVLVALLVPVIGFSQSTPDSLSLQSLVSRALINNMGLKNSQLEIEKSEKTKSQINHTFIPTLEASGRYAYTTGSINANIPKNPIQFPGITHPPILLPPFTAMIPAINQKMDFNGSLWMVGLTAKWTLFTGFKAMYLSKAMSHKAEAQKYQFNKKEADLISEISSLYDKIAILAQTQKVLNIQSKRLEKESQIAVKALQQGLITPHKFKKIEIAQLSIKSKRLEYEGAKDLLFLKLHQLTGLAISDLETIKVDIKIRNEMNTDSNTFLNRPELMALDEVVKAKEDQYKSEFSGYLPKIQAFASHQYLGLTHGKLGGLAYNELSGYPVNMIGVGFKWEIFDGLHTHGERQKLKIEMEQAQNRKQEVKDLLELNYKNCVSKFHNLTAQAKLKEKQVEFAKESVEISYKEYQNGQIQISDFLESQSDYISDTLDYYQTVSDQRNSVIELLKATGSLQINKL